MKVALDHSVETNKEVEPRDLRALPLYLYYRVGVKCAVSPPPLRIPLVLYCAMRRITSRAKARVRGMVRKRAALRKPIP